MGTNVDLELPIAAEEAVAGDGWTGGSTWILSRWDTLNICPDANGSILGVEELPVIRNKVIKYSFEDAQMNFTL